MKAGDIIQPTSMNRPRENKLAELIQIDHEAIEPFTIKPRFVCNSKGVFYIGTKTTDSETVEAEPMRLADTIDIIGSGADAAGNYYRVIQYRDKLTRQNKTAVIPTADIGSNQGWQRLQAWGIAILSGRAKRERLADYLQEQGSKTRYTITDKAGWHDGAYILPSGEVIQSGSQDSKIIYNGDKSQAAAYQESGSLEQWQAEIAQYAAGNSRLCRPLVIAAGRRIRRFSSVWRQFGRQNYRRPGSLERVGPSIRHSDDMARHRTGFFQHRRRPQ